MTVFSIQISNKIGLKCLIKALLIPLRPLHCKTENQPKNIVFSQTCCRSRVMTSISYELLTNYRAIKAILYEKSSKKAKNDQKALKMAKNPKNPPFLQTFRKKWHFWPLFSGSNFCVFRVSRGSPGKFSNFCQKMAKMPKKCDF